MPFRLTKYDITAFFPTIMPSSTVLQAYELHMQMSNPSVSSVFSTALRTKLSMPSRIPTAKSVFLQQIRSEILESHGETIKLLNLIMRTEYGIL